MSKVRSLSTPLCFFISLILKYSCFCAWALGEMCLRITGKSWLNLLYPTSNTTLLRTEHTELQATPHVNVRSSREATQEGQAVVPSGIVAQSGICWINYPWIPQQPQELHLSPSGLWQHEPTSHNQSHLSPNPQLINQLKNQHNTIAVQSINPASVEESYWEPSTRSTGAGPTTLRQLHCMCTWMDRKRKRDEKKERNKMQEFDPSREDALNPPIERHQRLNIHADRSGTMEAFSYSLCFCKKRRTIVPSWWNINASY